MPNNATVFISYSHDSDEHIDWVGKLACDLEKNQINTILDQNDLEYGDNIDVFMEQSIKIADFIILVCTEGYYNKILHQKDGVWEEQLLTIRWLLNQSKPRSHIGKCLPIVKSDDPSKSVPPYFGNVLFLTFSDEKHYKRQLTNLVRAIHKKHKFLSPKTKALPVRRHTRAISPIGSAAPKRTKPTSAGSPKAWVLVAGIGVGEINDNLRATCKTLGDSLARAGFGLVTGGWGGVDELTARSFASTLKKKNIAIEDRLIQVVAEYLVPVFDVGSVILASEGTEEYSKLVEPADAAIFIGGVGGTYETFRYARKYGLATFPLYRTGGDAEKAYRSMLRSKWRADTMRGIDRAKFFSVVEGETPNVVSDLVALIREWSNS